MADDIDPIRQSYGPDSLSTADVMAQYRAPQWGGLKSYLPDQPEWMKTVQGYLGRGIEAIPESVALAANFLPGAKVPMRTPRIENPIRAYHGSPHDFDKFDISKIGTGEGAQAYGHGLYFAESEPVARQYRDNISAWNNPRARGHTVNEQDLQKELAASGVDDKTAWFISQGAKDAFNQTVYQKGGRTDAFDYVINGVMKHLGESSAPVVARLDALKKEALDTYNHQGKMYEVALHPELAPGVTDPREMFIDWDRPLSQQSEAVRKALAATSQAPMLREDLVGPMKGVHVAPNTPAQMGEFREAGIPGIKYLDQGSRGMRTGPSSPANDIARQWLERVGGDKKQAMAALEGHLRESGQAIEGNSVMAALRDMRPPTSNYVVWSPEIIEILRKYGLMGPAALGAASAALPPDKAPQQ